VKGSQKIREIINGIWEEILRLEQGKIYIIRKHIKILICLIRPHNSYSVVSSALWGIKYFSNFVVCKETKPEIRQFAEDFLATHQGVPKTK
jgi:hypothetical protein